MAGYARNTQVQLGLIALIALRRAKAEHDRRKAAAPAEPVVEPKRRKGGLG